MPKESIVSSPSSNWNQMPTSGVTGVYSRTTSYPSSVQQLLPGMWLPDDVTPDISPKYISSPHASGPTDVITSAIGSTVRTSNVKSAPWNALPDVSRMDVPTST